jgi:hypothetical protein
LCIKHVNHARSFDVMASPERPGPCLLHTRNRNNRHFCLRVSKITASRFGACSVVVVLEMALLQFREFVGSVTTVRRRHKDLSEISSSFSVLQRMCTARASLWDEMHMHHGDWQCLPSSGFTTQASVVSSTILTRRAQCTAKHVKHAVCFSITFQLHRHKFSEHRANEVANILHGHLQPRIPR